MPLYTCATPIGNMSDITIRAIEVLSSASIILCEDTRVSSGLLARHGITGKKLVALHEHNENQVSQQVIEWLAQGLVIVQISDAGTPGISDPGARLINNLYQAGITAIPLPGASAFVTLASVSGIIDHYIKFCGFLDSKKGKRQKQLQDLFNQDDTAIAIYESSHRIIECLEDIVSVLDNPLIIMGRELTKHFETIKKDYAGNVLELVKNDHHQQKGEFAIIIIPHKIAQNKDSISSKQLETLQLLALELPSKKAVNLTYQICGGNKELMYQYLINNKP